MRRFCIITLTIAVMSACTEKAESDNTVRSLLASTEKCEYVTFGESDSFLFWTQEGNADCESEYTLNIKALALARGKGFSENDKVLHAAYPVSAFSPALGKGRLSENGAWFPISAGANPSNLKKIVFNPASNYLKLRIYSEKFSSTLYSVSVRADIPLCGEGDIAYHTDGRPYVIYSDNQGSKVLTVDMGSSGVPVSDQEPVLLTLPVPACINLDSITVDFRMTEGERSETKALDHGYMTFGETVSATVGRQESLFSEERNTMPYSDLDWNAVKYVNTTSHAHCEDDRTLDNLRKHNMEFFTLSNYHPATPTYPAGEMKAGRRGVPVTDYPLVINGILQYGPFDWNEIIGGWKDKLTPDLQKELPFKESDEKMFKTWVPGTLEAPNAEHYSFKFDGKYFEMHMCCPGSAYCSGTFDAHDTFGTEKYGGFNHGTGQHWRTGIDNMVKELVIPSGGGVTINHPTWSNLTDDLVIQILDYDARVLGIEILNSTVNDEAIWDRILATGRQCFGFCVPDHGAQDRIPDEVFGINVLLVHNKTVKDCLEAYRKGNFYGAVHGYGELSFTYLGFDGKTLKASTDKPALLEVITEEGIAVSTEGTTVEYSPKGIYARVRATAADGCGEILYSQPFILTPRQN